MTKKSEVRTKKEKRMDWIKKHAPEIAFVAAGIVVLIPIVYFGRKSLAKHAAELHTYSYGPDCIWKIEATVEEVDAFNRYLKAFYEAQTRILEKTGKPWDPSNPLWMNVKSGDNKIYNRLANRLNEALKLIDQDKTPIEIAGDYLVMN